MATQDRASRSERNLPTWKATQAMARQHQAQLEKLQDRCCSRAGPGRMEKRDPAPSRRADMTVTRKTTQ